MDTQRKFCLAGMYFSVFVLTAMPNMACGEFSSHHETAGKPALKANAKDLEHTIVTPHLEQEIPAEKNVLWCGTFQLAWNEFGKLNDGQVILDPPSPLVDAMNRQTTSERDFDKSSYLAMAGFASRGIEAKIRKQMEAKFNGRSSAKLLELNGGLPTGGLMTYAYLYKELPFRQTFKRFDDKLKFKGTEVDSFGIKHFGDGGKSGERMGKQVVVLDYANSDDLILELKTRSKADRLLLAKVPALETLAETIAAVERRVAFAEPTSMQRAADLFIPVLNFDIFQRYRLLEGRRLSSSSRRLNGKPLQLAAQSIRFRLDERGAVLISEARGGFGAFPDQNLIFDKPFLILLQRTSAENPYFALWVGNAELLVSSKKASKKDE